MIMSLRFGSIRSGNGSVYYKIYHRPPEEKIGHSLGHFGLIEQCDVYKNCEVRSAQLLI